VHEEDIRRLIAEVAERHRVVLRPDDPIFLTMTLNELVLQRYIERVENAVAAAEQRLSVMAAEHVAGTHKAASRIITDAAAYSAERLRAAGDEAARLVIEAIGRHPLEAEAKRRAGIVRAAYITGALVVMGIAAIGGFLAAGL
jgi:Transcriptional activator TraM.